MCACNGHPQILTLLAPSSPPPPQPPPPLPRPQRRNNQIQHILPQPLANPPYRALTLLTRIRFSSRSYLLHSIHDKPAQAWSSSCSSLLSALRALLSSACAILCALCYVWVWRGSTGDGEDEHAAWATAVLGLEGGVGVFAGEGGGCCYCCVGVLMGLLAKIVSS